MSTGSNNIAEGLKNVKALTNGMDDDQISALASIVMVENFGSDQLIVREDDSNRDILILKKGTASVEMKLKPGTSETGQIGKIRDDSIIGEFSFIDGSRRSADVKAIIDSVVYRLPHRELHALCEENHELGFRLMKNLATLMSQRLRTTNFELRAYLYL